MTPEMIAAIVGVLLSLAAEYIPVFKDWFNSLPDSQQKMVMLGAGLVVVYGAFGLGCAGLLTSYWACTWLGAYDALLVFLAYVLANQTTYALFLKKDK